MSDKLNLEIPQPKFDSELVELIIQLETLRKQGITINIYPPLFVQIKEIFHMIESIQSARIEGNRTTISDYVSSKFEPAPKTDSIREIQNIEIAINYVNKCFDESLDFKISNKFIKELHQLTTKDLKDEGSKESGSYRSCNVRINKSLHVPPNPTAVHGFMQKLIDWINTEDKLQTQLLKVAIAHHAFTWIHPFDNGNGRMARIFTYAMLRQYGFKMIYLMNTSAMFCMDRNKYFSMLQQADIGGNNAMLDWCEYVLKGLNTELQKISILMDRKFFIEKIVQPSINRAFELHYISQEQKKIMELSLYKEGSLIKSKDIQEILKNKTSRQINHLLSKMLNSGLLIKTDPKSRMYFINLINKDLIRGIIDSLYKEKLIIDGD